MATTMTLITSYEVTTSGQTIIDLTSIPGTYNNLSIKFSSRQTTAGGEDTPFIRFNNDSASNYNFVFGASYSPGTFQSGTTTTSFWIGTVPGAGDTANSFGNLEVFIPNYSSSTFKKTLHSESVVGGTAANQYRRVFGGYWNSTAAINRIQLGILSGGYQFAIGTTVYVYGIKNS